MASQLQSRCARPLVWWIERNPTYLLSAAAMTVGAKLYLDAPDARPGDVALILLTLGLLQAYKLAVSAVLVLLYRLRKGLDDQPSLRLVAAAFWTGPLAATLELTQYDPRLGGNLAIAACIAALTELWIVPRTAGLRLRPSCLLLAGLCIIVVTTAPMRLYVPPGVPGTDEIALYGFWWLLGGLTLLALPSIRSRGTPPTSPAYPRRLELAFLAIVIAATATHLYAMNYAFFGNARPFYAAPLLAAATIVLTEFFTRNPVAWKTVPRAVALLPVAAIVLSVQGFHQNVPLDRLPTAFRDPLVTTLLLAAVAWWYGFIRCRAVTLLHAASAAAALAVARILPFGATQLEHLVHLPYATPFSIQLVMTAFTVAAYLLIVGALLRSRLHIHAALAANLTAVALLVIDRTTADAMILLFALGWSLLIAAHAQASRPACLVRLAAVSLLIAVSCVYEFDHTLRPAARLHAIAAIPILFAVGWRWPWTRYRTAAASTGAVWLTVCVTRSAADGPYANATLAVVAAFALLIAGVVISCNKPRLTGRLHATRTD